MYKVVKYKPARNISASTSTSPFDRITEAGSPEEDVMGGFFTENEANEYMNELYRSNRL